MIQHVSGRTLSLPSLIIQHTLSGEITGVISDKGCSHAGDYRAALAAAGFEILAEHDRGSFALA
jgi:hypothetical protein